ncbi:MAG: hypothetical protein KBC56_04890 [Flavobacterium sp.]|nr:hypothetical protein [Flavobacterium sp.]
MKGAELAPLFKTGQYGRLYITSGSHARGRTLRIQVLPQGEEAIPNGENNQCLNKDAVSVYDVVGGNRGWTESYGWIHEGKWQEDFNNLVKEKQKEIEYENNERQKRISAEDKNQSDAVSKLLANY